MKYLSYFKSPLGFLILKSDGVSITDISFSEEENHEKDDCAVLLKCEQQLEDYFSKKSMAFDLPLNLQGTEFQKKVWA